MEDFPYTFDLEHLIGVARAAQREILAVYEEDPEEWKVQAKADESPVTKADLRANAVICDALTAKYPSIPITSEENCKVPYSERKEYVYSWNIDPLDGTKEFIKRNGQFATNIALVRGQEPVVGVVQVPCTGDTYWAVKGKGAFVRKPAEGDTDRRLECTPFEDRKQKGLTIIVSRRHRSAETEAFIAQYDEPKFIQLGSSLKFTKIAENEAHIYPRLAPTCEWDTAAPHLIVTEAGGSVVQCGRCDREGNLIEGEDWQRVLAEERPVLYNKEDDLNPFFIAYGKRTIKPANS